VVTRVLGASVLVVALALPQVFHGEIVGATPSYNEVAELEGSDTVVNDNFGQSVAVSGFTIVVGAWGHAFTAGRAYVFSKTARGWHQVAELKGSDTVIANSFGCSVAVSGTTIVVGALGHGDNAGSAYVFAKTATGWHQVAELKGSDTVANDVFGGSVAIAGDTIVVGALGHEVGAGRAYVFAKTATGWHQVAELKGSDTITNDYFGGSVAISGTNIVVGARQHASDSGRAYVFAKTATGWHQAAELKGRDTVAKDEFGFSVAISGTNIVAGASGDAAQAGRAYVFRETAGGWSEAAELTGSQTHAGSRFGDVAASGRGIVVGAPAADQGYVFAKTATGWHQAAELKGRDTVAHDDYGGTVAISGTTVVVGASGHASTAGRAYVFE
jgi:hypothetical protein